MSATVRVYTREGCHLCEDAIALVRRLAAESPADLTIELVDIDRGDPALRDAYTVRVPVVEVEGREVASLQVDEAALRWSLASLR